MTFDRKAYDKAYKKRPEVKIREALRQKKYKSKPGVKQRLYEYNRQWRKSPNGMEYYEKHKQEYSKYSKKYRSRPEIKAREKLRSHGSYLQHRHNKGDLTNVKRKPDYTNDYYCVGCKISSPKTGSSMCPNCGKKMRAGPTRISKTREVHRY